MRIQPSLFVLEEHLILLNDIRPLTDLFLLTLLYAIGPHASYIIFQPLVEQIHQLISHRLVCHLHSTCSTVEAR
jgi:hypothetical protein